MPGRTVKHPCKYQYTQMDIDIWAKAHPGKNLLHNVGDQCKASAVQFPKGSGKYEDFCAAHIRKMKKCPQRCQWRVVIGSHATKTRKAKGVSRFCKNCPLPGTHYCKIHTSGLVKHVARQAGPATLRAKRLKAATSMSAPPSPMAQAMYSPRPGSAPPQPQPQHQQAKVYPPPGALPVKVVPNIMDQLQ